MHVDNDVIRDDCDVGCGQHIADGISRSGDGAIVGSMWNLGVRAQLLVVAERGGGYKHAHISTVGATRLIGEKTRVNCNKKTSAKERMPVNMVKIYAPLSV